MKWVFWISLALIAYAYLGYPAWLWLRSWWSPRPVRRGRIEPTVSAVLVVKNEERAIGGKLKNLLALDYPEEKLNIVVVSDGSTDNTARILEDVSKESRVRAVHKSMSGGKAAGLNDAMKIADGEILLFTDARQEIEKDALRCLVENFADPDVACVSGELMLADPGKRETGKGMGLYWRTEKKVRELESASGSVVGATGAIYCARRTVLDSLPDGTILDDELLPMQIVCKRYRAVFDSRARAWDSPDLGPGREFARKVRTLTGNYQLLRFAPWLLSSRNPIRFQFVSHKLFRLGVPFALLAVFLASLFLSEPFYRAVLAGQIVFYGLSVAGIAGLKAGPLSRLADAARTFVVLNAAAVVAFINFVSGRKVAWTAEEPDKRVRNLLEKTL
jgi:biofilm PGA synthesis N-glycosyltransferase PgaC